MVRSDSITTLPTCMRVVPPSLRFRQTCDEADPGRILAVHSIALCLGAEGFRREAVVQIKPATRLIIKARMPVV